MAIDFLAELRALGVVLSIEADGRLAYDAPAGVLGNDLLARVRAERDALLELLTFKHTRPEYLTELAGMLCPWCQSGKRLVECINGLHCDGCNRLAFLFERDSIVRADCTF